MFNYDVERNHTPLVEGETLIWSAKPNRLAFSVSKFFCFLPVVLIWIVLFLQDDIGVLEVYDNIFEFFLDNFMLGFPIWLWLGNVLTINRKWKNTVYYVTDKRIIISSGFFNVNYKTIYYKDIKNISLKVGFLDQLFGVGDILFDLGSYVDSGNETRRVTCSFTEINNPYEIYPKLQKIVLDIQTDIEYPNALRPEENPGYNTKYKL